MKIEPCKDCGAKLRRSKKRKKNYYGSGYSAAGMHRIFCPECRQSGPEADSLGAAFCAWNKQQRVAQQREWPYTIRKEIVFLYRTIGRQIWLDCLEDKDVIEIHDHIMPVFEKHLELRKLVVKSEPEIEHDVVVKMPPKKSTKYILITPEEHKRILADGAQQLIIIGQLRDENKQLRDKIRQAVIHFQQLETQLDQSLACGKSGGRVGAS